MAGIRFDYPTGDGYKAHKFPTMKTTWKTWDPNRDEHTKSFTKYLFKAGMDLDQTTQIESILALLDLQDYFQNKKYPYVFYNTLSDADITNEDIKFMFDKIDKKRFFKPEYQSYWITLLRTNKNANPEIHILAQQDIWTGQDNLKSL